MHRFVVLAALATTLGAGCLGGNEDGSGARALPDTADAADVNADLGGIEGVVIDDEQVPVPDATVVINHAASDESQLSITAADGRFSFSLLPPGAYHVAVQAPFYKPRSQDVEVLAGQVKIISFLLDDVVRPSTLVVETVLKRGFINCSAQIYFAPQNVCSYAVADQAKFRVPIDPDRQIREVVLEAVWQPSNPTTGQSLELAICHQKDQLQDPYNCREVFGNYYWRGVRGPSPLTLRVSDLPLKVYPIIDSAVGAPPAATSPPTVPATFQQGFELWMSMCYNEICPESFQARPPK